MKTKSIWNETNLPEHGALLGDVQADVCVIGAGMAGLLTAYFLQEKGMRTVVIDAERTAGGVTQNTTAKITSQHGAIYSKLMQDLGEEKARAYAHANQKAIQQYKKLVDSLGVDCDFEILPSFLYGTDDEELLQAELKSARRAGIPAEYTQDLPLPFETLGAVMFPDQAQFHPLRFIAALSRCIKIFERTAALEVNGDTVVTANGSVRAKYIVFATHYPFVNAPGFYFMKMHQQRSYVIAYKNAMQLSGMYRDANEEGFSFRNWGGLLLLGGGSHRTGENDGGKYEKLRHAAIDWFPQAEEAARWSAQDCMTLDSVPYIGRYSIMAPNWYVATGFNKWGMTGSMVAASILSGMIAEEECEYEDLFSPRRMDVAASAKSFLENAVQSVEGLARELFEIPADQLSGIGPGEAGIIEYEGHKMGVYKTVIGEVHIVSTKCTHLGCQLSWNPDEKSWDCPCHGSRFNYEGRLLNNPAMRGIRPE